jgi:hypothetical protein
MSGSKQARKNPTAPRVRPVLFEVVIAQLRKTLEDLLSVAGAPLYDLKYMRCDPLPQGIYDDLSEHDAHAIATAIACMRSVILAVPAWGEAHDLAEAECERRIAAGELSDGEESRRSTAAGYSMFADALERCAEVIERFEARVVAPKKKRATKPANVIDFHAARARILRRRGG